MSLYTGTTAHVLTPDGPSDSFGVSAGVLQGDTLAPYIFVLVVDYVMRRAIDEAGEECGFQTQRRRSRRYPAKYLTDLDFADDIALLSSTIQSAQRLLSSVEHCALSVGLRINRKKTEYMQLGDVKDSAPHSQ